MNNNTFSNPKAIKYEIQHIDDSYFGYHPFYASQISNNEQYLAYGGKEGMLNIYDIKLNEIKKYYYQKEILVCQFTFDSSKLYIGCSYGYVYGLDVLDDFRIIFEQKLKDHVYYIITIKDQYLITVSRDKTITKFDIKWKKQIFKYNCRSQIPNLQMRREDYIDAIDYNQIDDIIIIGYLKLIYIWDCKNRRSFIKYKKSRSNRMKVDLLKYSHKFEISQLQLFNKNQYVLSLDIGSNLCKWKIDYLKKDILKIQEFKVPCEISSFFSFNQDQNLLMICQGYLKIINNQGQTIYTLYHKTKNYYLFFDSRQPENLRYINIRDRFGIYLAIQK